ncbi:MAG: SIMPL domain-containing protein [Candidatus Margulisiibacteriota bacterium]|jgi:hypothetical protein
MIKNLNDNKNVIQASLILGVCFILCALVVSITLYRIKAMDQILDVNGSARQSVIADIGKLSGSFSRSIAIENLKAGNEKLSLDLALVTKFLEKQGVSANIIEISPVFMDEDYNANSKTPNSPKKYILRRNISFQTTDIGRLALVSQRIGQLINSGVIFSLQNVEYYYSKLPEARIALLGQAIEDARLRAKEIAKNSGRRIGALKSASMGPVQVLPPNSTNVVDYGAYDTSTIDKEVMVTLRASFKLK